ncbi:MAG: beta-propeller domain-containing protein, partial [Myxococcales bacterium]|nr:beta-propeller domain-containing protein [Myxococcales bacterium]
MTILDRLLDARFGNLTSHLGKSLALAALCGFGLPACTDGGDGNGGPGVEQESTSLQAFGDCDELLGYFQEEALSELQHWGWFGGGGFERDAVGAPSMAGGEGAADPNNQGGDLGGLGGQGEVDFSTTNNQEVGVDEPDQVKTDGEFLYVVRHNQLFIYAAADLSLQSATNLGTYGARLLLDGDRLAVVADRWDGDLGDVEGVPARFARTNKAEITVYDIADRAAPQALRRTVVEGNVVTARLVDGTARVVVHFDAANYVDFGDLPGYGGAEPPRAEPGVAVGGGTSVDPDEDGGTDTATPEPAPMPDGMEQRQDGQAMDFEAAVRQLIEDSVLDDWIPYRVDELEGERAAAPIAACRQFHRPGERGGHGVTAVVSVDLDAPNAGFADPAVVTAPGVVYASSRNLYLTTVNHAGWLWGGGGVAV